jgi:hypothetical protein
MASEEKAQRLLANSRLHPGLLGLITPCHTPPLVSDGFSARYEWGFLSYLRRAVDLAARTSQ